MEFGPVGIEQASGQIPGTNGIRTCWGLMASSRPQSPSLISNQAGSSSTIALWNRSLRERVPLVMSGDLHAVAVGRMMRSGKLDFSPNPINAVLTGPTRCRLLISTWTKT
jgi:hypothetical protein